MGVERDIHITYADKPFHLRLSESQSSDEIYATIRKAAAVDGSIAIKVYSDSGALIPIGPHMPANDATSKYKMVIPQGRNKPTPTESRIVEALRATNAILTNVPSLKQNMSTVKSRIELDASSHLVNYSANDPALKPAMLKVAKLQLALDDTQVAPKPVFSQEVLEHLKHPTFDIWQWNDHELMTLIEWMFEDLQLISEFSLDVQKLGRFLSCVRHGYNSNPFHNFRHCFCVTQMVYGILYVTGVHKKLTSLEKLILLISAIGHDLDHPGYNNAYQINASTDLSIVYNDISPLENHHAAVLFTLLKNDSLNFLASLSSVQYKDLRKSVIGCILATDMAKHGEILAKFKGYAENFDFGDASQRQILLQLIIKCADISNEVRPKHVAEPWVDKLLEEFFGQSDREKREGLPTAPFMDRDKVTKPSAQVGFIGFVMIPLYELMSKVLPNMDNTLLQPIRRAHEYYKSMLEKKE
ncbi:High affinity cAMP-specific and IBMX-insensitive 3',5'-cyclic phosphodiesterase 9A [Phlyctochytrium planicorne]|nr:High affinity cAMP-specific and IBMX-insensitive 3',5'-cyclic phosphodiesterase 9A [Phlyctochytrium planicorne]